MEKNDEKENFELLSLNIFCQVGKATFFWSLTDFVLNTFNTENLTFW